MLHVTLLEHTPDPERLIAAAAKLDAMSPLKVLGRGYAMARNEAGQVLKSSGETHIGERIHVTLGSGGLTAVVDHIEEARNGG